MRDRVNSSAALTSSLPRAKFRPCPVDARINDGDGHAVAGLVSQASVALILRQHVVEGRGGWLLRT